MKCCTFCSNEAQMVFYHMTHEIGLLCLNCYMTLHGACSVCSESFLPSEVKEDVTLSIRAKFISMSEKNIIVCDCCYEEIQRAFPEQMV